MCGNNLCCKVDCRDGKKVRKRDLGVLGQNRQIVANVPLPKRTFDCDSCCLFVPPWLCQDFRFCLPAPLFRMTKAILSSLPGPGYPCHLRLVPVGADGFCSAQAGYLPDVLSFPFPVFSSFSRSFLPVLKSEHTNAPGARCVLPGRCGFEPLCRPSAIPITLPSLPLLPWRQQHGPVSGGSLCLFYFLSLYPAASILPLLPYSTSMKSRSFLPLEG